jgi:hypothetical protein
MRDWVRLLGMNSTTTILCKLGFNKFVSSFPKYGYSLYVGWSKTTNKLLGMNSTTTVLCKLGFKKVVSSFPKYGYSLYEG